MTRHRPILDLLEQAELVRFTGAVRAIGQHSVEADGPFCSVGEFCEIESSAGDPILAQVVAIASGGVTLLPLAATDRVRIAESVAIGHCFARISPVAVVIAISRFAGPSCNKPRTAFTRIARLIPSGALALELMAAFAIVALKGQMGTRWLAHGLQQFSLVKVKEK